MKTQLKLIPELIPEQEYKIQTRTLWGWGDLKFSEDGHNYYCETFASKEDAEFEVQEIVESLEESDELYRVVVAEEVEDINIYR
jgi:hypothetical protein